MKKLIVRRGLSHSYYTFLGIYAQSAGVDIVEDRRKGERRCRGVSAQPDRRAGERRGPPPHTWDLADFVAIETPED